MTVIFSTGYTLPSGDQPLTHARIAHSGNWLSGGTITADTGAALLLESGDGLLLESGDAVLLESANNAATGFFVDGPANTLTYEKWKPGALPATWEYDHGGTAQCDYCVIAAHTMGTSGNTLQVQYWNGSSWTGLIAASAITTDEPIFVIFPPQTRQRWRIQVSNGSPPEIGVIKFGKAMQMERALYGGHTPIPFARQTILRSNYSETGESLGRTRQRTFLATVFAWQNLTAAWVRANWLPFQKAAEAEPFVIAWRPATFGDVALCQLDASPAPQNTGTRDLMAVEMQVRARGYD